MKGYFVTGTGTGVGKTHVTAAIARRAVTLGKRVFAFKPVESGCQRVGAQLVGADQELLCNAAGNWQTGELRGLYQLEPAISPAAAAARTKVEIDIPSIAATVQRGAAGVDLVLVEGAGGWRVPLTEQHDIADLARTLELPVIVVASATLGTVNHSLLTIEAVESSGCEVVALVLSQLPTDDSDFSRENVEWIARRWNGDILICAKDTEVLDCFT